MTSDNFDFARKIASTLNAAAPTSEQAVFTLVPSYEPTDDSALKIFVAPSKRDLKRVARDGFEQNYVAQVGFFRRVSSASDPEIETLTRLTEDAERTLYQTKIALDSGLVCEVNRVETSATYDAKMLSESNVFLCVLSVYATTYFNLT